MNDQQMADFLSPLVTRFVQHRGRVNRDTAAAIVQLARQQQFGPDGPLTRPGLEEIAEAAEAFPASDVLTVKEFFHGRL
ncbi:MAG: hypothetical protein IT436_09835 [Phycisphaerales bacterium]|nr:hypothetical protein [Phycisphaerales bacterium]